VTLGSHTLVAAQCCRTCGQLCLRLGSQLVNVSGQLDVPLHTRLPVGSDRRFEVLRTGRARLIFVTSTRAT
jgi:hypothetical protein